MQERTKLIIWYILLVIGLSPLIYLIYTDIGAFLGGMVFFGTEYKGWEAVIENTVLYWAFLWRHILAGIVISAIAGRRVYILKRK